MTLLEAARQALEEWHTEPGSVRMASLMIALSQAIEQAEQCVMENAQGDLERISLVQTGVGIGKPEQEPVAWLMSKPKKQKPVAWVDGYGRIARDADSFPKGTTVSPLFAHPPQQPLTDEEIALIVGECAASAHRHDDFSFARAIERAHGIGN
jgi:hypothetical protein